MKEFYEIVFAHRHLLSESENDLANYLIAHQDSIEKLKLNTLANENFTSTTTVIRLCKKLGFSGWSELQYFIKMQSKIIHENTEKNAQVIDDSFITRKKLAISSVQNTLDNINYATLKEVAEAICQCHCLKIYGLSSSRFVCEDFVRKLSMLEIWGHTESEEEMITLSSSRVRKNDLVFIISLTGNNDTLVSAVRTAKKRGVRTISLTNSETNTIASETDTQLYIDVPRQSVHYNRFRSRYSFMIVMELIVEECITYLKEKNKDHFNDIEG
ncbi:MAG: MurR/RpiR family transcriptional regulator [Culicoidibacterales bacterium]